MLDVLLMIVSLLVALSLLIAVHELGHFLVARWSGVKVLRFSIGFGKPLWQRRYGADQTEYTIASIPLGGYVKMLDEREGEVAPEELHRAFNRQSLLKRSAIVVAGPLFNFLFAIVAYWLMFVIGVSGVKSVVGEVETGTIAYEAGIRSGQEILAVDGKDTPTLQSALEEIMPRMLLNESATLTVFDGGLTVEKTLMFSGVDANQEPRELFEQLGIKPSRPPTEPVIDELPSGSVAEKAGLKVGDRIVSAAGKEVSTWQDLVDVVSKHPDIPMTLVVSREGEEITIPVKPEAKNIDGELVGRLNAIAYGEPVLSPSMLVKKRYGFGEALPKALEKTWDMSSLTLRMIGEMIAGRASVENLSGPIGIAQHAKQSASAGLDKFLKFLGLISVSLAVLNLLPIPVLDGGHLMFYLIEAVQGRPVSEQMEALGQRIGLAMILALMLLAIYNDLARIAAN